MSSKALLFLLALFLATRAGHPESKSEAEAEAARLFTEGRAQVEANCAECFGATAEALAAGLDTVRRALDLGHPEQAEGLRLLAEGWGNLAWGLLDPGEPGQERAAAAQREAYERWLEVEPENPAALYGYALTLLDPERRRIQLERLLAVDAKHVEGLAALGLLELEEGQTDEGLAHLQQAFDGARYERAEELGLRLLDAYEQAGESERAAAVRARLTGIRAELRSLERGEVSPE